jgi:ribonucleoside-triphosphate reductase
MVKENTNMGFSLQGLNNYIATKIISNYWMRRIYPEAVRKVHEAGVFIFTIWGLLVHLCWLGRERSSYSRVKGVKGKVESRPQSILGLH